jgi:hypothetical protein
MRENGEEQMNDLARCVFILFIIDSRYALAGEYELARLSLPPCTKIEWRSEGTVPGFKIQVPVVKTAPQELVLSARVEGSGVDAAENDSIIRSCVSQVYSSIGLSVTAWDTGGATGLFKELITNCVHARAPRVNIAAAYIKSATSCAW